VLKPATHNDAKPATQTDRNPAADPINWRHPAL